MTIDLSENSIGFWLVQGERSNWIAGLSREPTGHLTVTHRFRVFIDERTFDSDDPKTWRASRTKAPVTPAEDARFIAAARKTAATIAQAMPGEMFEILMIDCASAEDFAQRVAALPGMTTKIIPESGTLPN